MTAALQADPPPSLAAPARLDHVPFVPQADYQCGPAALAMALAASGRPVGADALVAEVWLPARAGSLQAEMLAAARRHGRLAVVLPPRLDALLAEVAAGTPVIVLQNLALPVAPRWHYAVAIGYDLARGDLSLHSGTTAATTLPLAVFERTWARSGHWAMLAVAPDRLPASVGDEALLAAAAALERVDAAAARQSYAALVARQPRLTGAWLGLGNALHASGDLRGAEQAFDTATRIDADAADAWNNLALTRLALGHAGSARAAAERAVALGGPRAERYRDTLAAIERALAGGSR
jgi:tetratricopeptide (TPR) repeat protein